MSPPGRLTAAISLLAAAPALAADIGVTVDGLRSDDGDVHVALYDDPTAFPKSGRMLRETEAEIGNREAVAWFRGLPAGRYAVAVYHDEDGDDEFDRILFGLPAEGFGFSNRATIGFGPPSFDEAAVAVEEPAVEIRITVDY